MKSFIRFFIVLALILTISAAILPGRYVRLVLENSLGYCMSLVGVEECELVSSGRVIRYWKAGSAHKEAVVLLHGAGGDALSTWFRFIPHLAKGYAVYALQLRFGNLTRADQNIENFFWEQNDLLSLLKSEEREQVSLVGLSAGSWFAALFARNYPQHVNKLVLVSPMGTHNELVLEPLLASDHSGQEFARKIFYSPPPFLFLFTGALGDEVDRAISALQKIYRPEMLASMDVVRRGSSEIATPTLLIWGENDQIIPRQVPEELAVKLKNARLVVLPKAGHALVWDAFDRVAALLDDFLREQSGVQ